jgi:hypothetical protein|tara:strand:+ start:418 stop:537 length:120 start_codon:yes stop_codon:yes gene_type:complete
VNKKGFIPPKAILDDGKYFKKIISEMLEGAQFIQVIFAG